MMGLGMGTGIVGVGLMILFWAGLVGLAVWLVQSLFPRVGKLEPASLGDLDAAEILDWRYARGEIDRDQYELMKETLST
jgi:putative membrane protein